MTMLYVVIFHFSILLLGYMFEGVNAQAYIIQEILTRIIDKLFILANEIFENSFDCHIYIGKSQEKLRIIVSCFEILFNLCRK